MKLKSAIKYRYNRMFKISAVFYILMLELVIGSFIIKGVTKSDFAFDTFFSVIMWAYTFILGFVSYTGEIDVLLQNGVSRQSIHKSFIALLPLNAVFAFVSVMYDFLDFLLMKGTNASGSFSCYHLFYGLYFSMPKSVLLQMIIDFILVAAAYIMLMSLGYMLGSVSRSMKLFYKVLFGAIVVALTVLAFTLYNYMGVEWFDYSIYIVRAFFRGTIAPEFSRKGNFVFSMLILTVINTSIAHLLINRAAVRKGADRK